ncbi:carboxypeptidase-like regulatory domain-containing protein [Hymenobacter sp. ASUV-10]|uniref:Carboxypeptidase-like regulatory domain-containing protein n=1 Tax=Hymenobacter aranciens TaxID=3063996 RepID=A0ABT9BF96_9BACT|nr:carboxypeptidase-like regulatory domain-containing protein [Hymenobacter sp. ASUV-10]MDO7876948.1 carboxypeptidase-like regulatory domain-containing protein [Hymenobacter sp. ASUV-10]
MKLFRLFLVMIGLVAINYVAQAQGKITGVALDSVTREPLAFASVFLANTTQGETTTDVGKFEFKRVPPGTYDLVGSYVGYRLGKQSVTVTAGGTQQVTVLLAPTGNQLAEVVVQPEPNKPEEYQEFSKLFLGGSTFSEQCHITNPDDVRVLYDAEDDELSARAKNYAQIENDALGYRLKYYGLEFNYDKGSRSVSYYGQPVFEEMKPRDEAQRKLWEANRLIAYKGSFMHFLRSVYRNRLRTEGFMAQQVRVIINNRYGQTDSLRRMLLERHPDGSNLTKAEKDSLSLWSRSAPIYATLNPAALPIDSIRRASADGKRVYLRFTGELQVTYFGEAPDPKYGKPMSSLGTPPKGTTYPAKRQVSRLRLQGKQAEIQADGSLLNPLDVSNGEYWGFEKIGEFLPFDYTPPTPATGASSSPPTRP